MKNEKILITNIKTMSLKELFNFIKKILNFIINYDLKKIFNFIKISIIIILSNIIIILLIGFLFSNTSVLYLIFKDNNLFFLIPLILSLVLFILLLLTYFFYLNKYLIDKFIRENKNKFNGTKISKIIFKIIFVLVLLSIILYIFSGNKNNKKIEFEKIDSVKLQKIIEDSSLEMNLEGKVY